MLKYFIRPKFAAKLMVGNIQKIKPKHFDEICPYIDLGYYQFRVKLSEVFQQANIAHARSSEWCV